MEKPSNNHQSQQKTKSSIPLPDDMPDHELCLKVLHSVLDDEATPEEISYFKAHVENCMPYYEIYNLDKKIKELLKEKCCKKEVPEDLVRAIKAKIQESDGR